MTSSTGTRSIEALEETVRLLWPDASATRFERSDRGRSGPVAPGDVVLCAMPNAASARLLVPSGARAAAEATRRYSAALTPREIAQRAAVAATLRVVGPMRLLPDRIHIVGGDSNNIRAHLGRVCGAEVSVSLGIGNERANRKPVLGAFDRAGTPLAYAKVGDSPVSAGHVAGEADALSQLGRATWTSLLVPSLLDHTEWNGMPVLAMSALRTNEWQGLGSRTNVPRTAATELASVFDQGRSKFSDTPWWTRCASSVSAISDERVRSWLSLVLARVHEVFADRQVRVTAWHGDFAPWNVARRGAKTQLWDWERFEQGVPGGMDQLHYAVSGHRSTSLPFADAIAGGLRQEAPKMDDPSSADALAVVSYLTSLTIRYLCAAELPGGGVILDSGLVALEALDGFVSNHAGQSRTIASDHRAVGGESNG